MNNVIVSCVVDVDNKFAYNGENYIIHNSVQEYAVKNSYKNVEDYENIAEMIYVYVKKVNDEIFFYNEKMEEIDRNKIGKVGLLL